mgnify:CR=1 FL=1
MLSYQHAYHAGNHADVLKHAALSLCLEALKRKPKPFFALDTHAGRGRYDLRSTYSEVTGEATAGIERLWPALADQFPEPYAASLNLVNRGNRLRNYPGSCQIIADQLRPQDHAVFCERHPAEFAALDKHLGTHHRCQLRFDDGFATARAVIPPEAGRGLILLDPSYETASDYTQVLRVVSEIHHRFRAGIVLVWLPVISRSAGFLDSLVALAQKDIRTVTGELRVRASTAGGMSSSAVYILNAPWQVDEALQRFLDAAVPLLAEDTEAKARVLRYGD